VLVDTAVTGEKPYLLNMPCITKLCKMAMNLSFHVLLLKSVMSRLYFKLCFVWNFLRNAIKLSICWFVNL